MGITPGANIQLKKKAPLGDPIEINVRGYELTLRKDEACLVTLKLV
jgi:Fe2+ transport system protein FeoA